MGAAASKASTKHVVLWDRRGGAAAQKAGAAGAGEGFAARLGSRVQSRARVLTNGAVGWAKVTRGRQR